MKEVRDGTGTLKGWYCDITRPAVLTGTELLSEDLDLDLWRSADGATVLRLDEDEFARSGLARTDPEAARAALGALDSLEALALEPAFQALLT
ncbi:putative RNA-binding protein associated with RNAse of E/G family [Streptomyces sp. B3I8]|nr:putative RNA-binding protein associated with RNAse of E/G family [Streptomyces sp. B3I8]